MKVNIRSMYSHQDTDHDLTDQNNIVVNADNNVIDAMNIENDDTYPGDNTSKSGYELLNDYRTGIPSLLFGTTRSCPSAVPVHLYPILESEGNGNITEYRLRIKIGTGKLYNVRNLTILVDTVQNRQIYPLGKNKEIDFSSNTFDIQSKYIYQMIRQFVIGNRNKDTKYSITFSSFHASDSAANQAISSYIIMMPYYWDVLYEFISNKGKLTYQDIPVIPTESDPDLHLTLAQKTDCKGKLDSVILSGTLPRVFNGRYGNYCLIINKRKSGYYLHRISTDFYKRISPLYTYQHEGYLNIIIGLNHLNEFFFNVLPELRKLVDIDESELTSVNAYLPSVPSFSVYLDIDNNVPVCRLEAVYGDKRYSVFNPNTANTDKNTRCEPLELKACELIRQYFPHVDAENDRCICGNDDDSFYHLLDEGISVMSNEFEVKSTKEFNTLYDTFKVRRPPPVNVGVSIEGGLLNIAVNSNEISREELISLLKSYKLKKKYHRLRNGGFVRIGTEVEDLNELFETLHVTPKKFVSGKMNIPAYRALYLDKMLMKCNSLYTTRDQRFRSLVKRFDTIRYSDYKVPVSLRNIMRKYQLFGFKWLLTLSDHGFGGILADDMGLGKTLQIISVLLSSHSSEQIGPSLVICPASLVYNWQEEFSRFAPELKVETIVGKRSEREALINNCASYDVLITSYGILKRDIELYENISFNYEILDEAQNIKTQTTGSARCVKLIRAAHRFALTGTPIENRLSELWSIFDFLMPGYLYGYETFKNKYEVPIVRQNDNIISSRLRNMVAPFILRRLKKDVLNDLPDKIEEILYVRFKGEQKKLYDAQALRMKNIINSETDDETKHSKFMLLAEFMRIRQICCDPGMLFEDYSENSAKRSACIELIKSAISGEHRILLFSQFTTMLDLLKKDLTQSGIEWYTITGSTPKKERVDLVKKFNEGDTPVFLISLKAGGTGLNLTGADVVIHYDPWWNIAAQNQATDRAHRIGQTKNVCVYKLIAKDTIEENILKLQRSKKDLADNILSGELGGLAGMSRKDLLDLIG